MNHVIIMAGGVGSRFWPLSTPKMPKQFIDIMGMGRTMIQMTVDRFLPICPIENIWVVTNEAYVSIVHEQLPGIPMCNILAEPAARNTAPCIAYAGWKIKQKDANANLVVTPSDALVLDPVAFRGYITEALSFTENKDAIVTIGIKPTRPETGYGYVQSQAATVSGNVHKVDAFREKPDLETAKQYFADSKYLWNAGIFVWNVNTLEQSIRNFAPQIARLMDEMASSFYTDKENAVVGEKFVQSEKISIDYAVMEKHPQVFTIPSEFGWSDLGNWASLHGLLTQDDRHNAAVGNVKFYDCENCVVHVAEERNVVVQGLDGYIVSEKNGQLLICKKTEEQRIKEFSSNL
ncbi:MAG: mannose-1-phosphate guanylyltransferase [Paludibacteraceae bacterium]|nr:mannose-1-phosphate guanylyltransferase [Paludibacteraceae bacterium]